MDGDLAVSATASIDSASTRPLRILYHHRIVSRDGQSVHVDAMIAALRGFGHSVLVAAPSQSGGADGEPPRWLAALRRALPPAVYELMELAYNLPAFARLYRASRTFAPDLIYERYNLNLLAGVWLARLTRTPLLLEVNAPLAQERADFGGGLRLHPLAWRIENWIWRNADRVLPVSTPLAKLLREAGVAAERIAIIPNAVDPAVYDAIDNAAAKRALGLDDKIVLGFAGFMRDWHGLEGVIEGLAQADLPRNAHLLLVGDGPARTAMAERATALGIADRVSFAGVVPRAQLPRHIAAFDIALQPRAVAYASPLKLFEYMAAGKAVVAPDQSNIRELLVAEESALLFDSRHKGAIFEAIRRLAGDEALRRRLGTAARRRIDQRGFTWRENARRVAGLGSALVQRQVRR